MYSYSTALCSTAHLQLPDVLRHAVLYYRHIVVLSLALYSYTESCTMLGAPDLGQQLEPARHRRLPQLGNSETEIRFSRQVNTIGEGM